MRRSWSWTVALPHLALISVFVLWGYNNVPMKIGGIEWNPVLFNAFRYAGIAPVVWAYTYWYYRRHRLEWSFDSRDWLPIAGYALLSSAGMEVVLSYALPYSTAANAAILGRGMIPVWVGIVALSLREMSPSARTMAGIPLAFGGTLLIVAGNPIGIGPDTWRGDVLLLLRSVFGAVYMIGMRGLLRKYPVPLLLAIEISISGAVLLPFGLLTAPSGALAAVTADGWFSLAYASIVALFIGFLLHNWGLSRLGPFKASVYGYLMPLSAALAGYVTFGEQLRWYQLAGGAAVLIAMYLIQSDRMKEAKPG
ncbi:DMT family transporter [Paenibacillus thermotolerans]|uniref:DMT family transporter n=1 Tax=Paenibacillus thermotolerans TaxID=3027807 RepID=UPI0023682611|nr:MULTISPECIES: DMT family transporter [unclassified Paenibacillus]